MVSEEQLQALRARISQITPERAHALQSQGAALIDVREADEHAQGLAEGAIPISRGELPDHVGQTVPDTDRTVVLICARGPRSLMAADTLRRMGYRDLHAVDGGFTAWQRRGLPWSVPDSDDPAAGERYARQVRLPEIGPDGQRRLAAARIAVIGAGGLGSPAALYLAAAGVGRLGLIDDDRVERNNLHRQVLHDDRGIGQAKADSGRARLAALNPDIRIDAYRERLSSANVERLLGDYDLVVDGSDNFPTRYLLNDACIKLGLTNISAAVQGLEGQLAVFAPEGPCYRCLFPEPPAPEAAPSCAEAGVLGMVPGVMGLLQALEAMKLIVGFGEPLVGRLLVFDAATSAQRILRLRRDPDCPYCAPGREFPGYIDYQAFCAGEGS